MAGIENHSDQWLGNLPTEIEVLPPENFVDRLDSLEQEVAEQAKKIRELKKTIFTGLETSDILLKELENQIAKRDLTIQQMERDHHLQKVAVISTIQALQELLPPEKRTGVPPTSASMRTVADALKETCEVILQEYML